MRFKTSTLKEPKHSELVSCVSWASPDDVISIADDHKVELNFLNLLSNIKLPKCILKASIVFCVVMTINIYITHIHLDTTMELSFL